MPGECSLNQSTEINDLISSTKIYRVYRLSVCVCVCVCVCACVQPSFEHGCPFPALVSLRLIVLFQLAKTLSNTTEIRINF